MPIGVAMLPRFAAMVSNTNTFKSASGFWMISNNRIVKGTKVINVTSFVMSMLEKKHKRIMIQARLRTLFAFFSNLPANAEKTPKEENPSTMIIRQKSKMMVR